MPSRIVRIVEILASIKVKVIAPIPEGLESICQIAANGLNSATVINLVKPR
jgi:hypothetical protein